MCFFAFYGIINNKITIYRENGARRSKQERWGAELLSDNLFVSLLLNVGFVMLLATVLTEIRPLREIYQQSRRPLGKQMVLAALFTLSSISCTYTGLELQGAVVNTRVVSTLVAGLVGGPLSGLITGLLSGIHRYWFDPRGFTSLACAIGTFLFGVAGAVLHGPYLKLHKQKQRVTFLLASAAMCELIQCGVLFLVARPFAAVLVLEKTILLPKIIINSLGVLLFVSVLDRLNRDLAIELVEQQSIALYIAQKCLPYLREGMQNVEGLSHAAGIIRETMPDVQVAITDRTRCLAASGLPVPASGLPPAARQAIEEAQLVVLENEREEDPWKLPEDRAVIAAPLTRDSYVIGTLILVVRLGRNLILDADIRTAEGLSQLFSTMLELGSAQQQIHLRQQAEFRALQSQINPHFLYNALNTISALCRTDPDRARELILVLANYFRQTLSVNRALVTLEEELSNVNNYLTLAQARFEDDIHVTMLLPEDLSTCYLPPLLLQPLVENAVRHGRTSIDERYVRLEIRQEEARLYVCVSDRGHGFPEQVLRDLNDPDNQTFSGLFNVRKRLRAVYGTQCQFQIVSTPSGSSVSFSIPVRPPVDPERSEDPCELQCSTMKSTPAMS